MSLEIITHNKITWVEINSPTLDDIQCLKDHYVFHPLALEDCLSKIERPRIDEYDNHFFIVLHFPIFQRERRLNRPGEIDIFIGPDYLVTVHEGNLKPILKFWEDCQSLAEAQER